MEGVPTLLYGTGAPTFVLLHCHCACALPCRAHRHTALPQRVAEQGLTEARAPLWASGYARSGPLFTFLRTSVAYRRRVRVWDAGVAQAHPISSQLLGLSRGDLLLVLSSSAGGAAGSSVGDDAAAPADGVQMMTGLPPRFRGKALRNIYNPKVRREGGGSVGACLHSRFFTACFSCSHHAAADAATPAHGCCRLVWTQDVLTVSVSGIGLLLPDKHGQPQVYYLGPVQQPGAFALQDAVSMRWHQRSLACCTMHPPAMHPPAAESLLLPHLPPLLLLRAPLWGPGAAAAAHARRNRSVCLVPCAAAAGGGARLAGGAALRELHAAA